MEVEPSVVKNELLDIKKTAEHAKDIKDVATRLDDIGSDHIPTGQYRSGVQIKTDLLTRASSLIDTAKQGERADEYIKEARELLTAALKVKADQVYSTKLVYGDYHMPSYSLKSLITRDRKSVV